MARRHRGLDPRRGATRPAKTVCWCPTRISNLTTPAGAGRSTGERNGREAHPRAAFRTANELGRGLLGLEPATGPPPPEEAQISAGARSSIAHSYLAVGGPMFGPDTLVYGGRCVRTSTTGRTGASSRSPHPQFDRPQATSHAREQFGCQDGSVTRPGSAFGARSTLGGKRLFTPTNAGGADHQRFSSR